MNPIQPGKMFTTISFGYNDKILLPLDDAATVLKCLENAVILTGYGVDLKIQPFGFDESFKFVLVSEVEINKILLKSSLGT
jgi:hypothetical protein